MKGDDIGKLSVLINANESGQWDTLFTRFGNQGNEWINQTISLSDYDDKAAIFRIEANTTIGAKGDIAIDQIEFRGSVSKPEGFTYYQDLDIDGYGNILFPVNLCSTIPTAALSSNSEDCDDNNPDIKPDAEEVPCNGIDENCNGTEDDNPIGEPLIYTASITPDNCNNPGTGSISLSLQGGNPPFTYVWNNNANTKDINGITAGKYTCEITDATLCSIVTEEINVSLENDIEIIITNMIHPSCLGQGDGFVSVTAENGTAPYQFYWSDGTEGSENNFINAGLQYVIAEDANNCISDTLFLDIAAEGSITGDISFQLNVKCHGGNDGVLQADAITGVPPFTYIWGDQTEGKIINGLTAGNYICTITDSQGCQVIIEAEITEPNLLKSNIVSQENVPCFGEHTGSIVSTVTGGTGPYSYAWNSGQVTDDIFDLGQGLYSLTVTDANGCKAVLDSVNIREPEEFIAEVDSALFAKCILSSDGYLSVVSTGGTPSYNYFWGNTSADTSILESVKPGIYNLTITDQNNCKTTINNFLLEAQNIPIEIDLSKINENKCADDSIVQIIANISEASFPVDYNWSNGQQTIRDILVDSLNFLPQGEYSLTVTDAEGCLGYSDTIMIESGIEINFNIEDKKDNICFDDTIGSISVNVVGGLSPYQYLWSNGEVTQDISNLPTDKYILTITDNNDCSMVTQSISINSTPPLEIEINTTPTATTQADGKIELNIIGGTSPYKILWENNIALENSFVAEGLNMGSYTISISDVNNCDTIVSAFIDFSSSTNNLDLDDLRISPNPFTNNFEIRGILGVATLRIFDINGKLAIPSRLIREENEIIALDRLNSGIYLLELSNESGKVLKKVVKL